jgi:O-antigen/teichoic acid export membrane protein
VKFRALLYIAIAVFSLGLQLLLVKKYGGIGCAAAICTGLVLGHIIVMNIYYYKKQGIDIPKFWKEIGKMSVTPLILGSVTFFLIRFVELQNIFTLGLGVFLFSLIYIPTFWFAGMNQSERDLMKKPMNRVLKKLKIS